MRNYFHNFSQNFEIFFKFRISDLKSLKSLIDKFVIYSSCLMKKQIWKGQKLYNTSDILVISDSEFNGSFLRSFFSYLMLALANCFEFFRIRILIKNTYLFTYRPYSITLNANTKWRICQQKCDISEIIIIGTDN